MRRNRPVSLALAGLFLAQHGCAGSAHGDWETVAPPYAAAFEGREAYEVRMVVGDSVVVLKEPTIDGDSIRGERQPYYEKSVHIEAIQSLEAVWPVETEPMPWYGWGILAACTAGIAIAYAAILSDPFFQ